MVVCYCDMSIVLTTQLYDPVYPIWTVWSTSSSSSPLYNHQRKVSKWVYREYVATTLMESNQIKSNKIKQNLIQSNLNEMKIKLEKFAK